MVRTQVGVEKNVHRAIPPDSAHAGLPVREGVQHEAVGDLYFAADNFGAAVESYAAALKDAAERPPAERLELMLRLARASFLRADYAASLEVLADARALARSLREPRLKARGSVLMAAVAATPTSPTWCCETGTITGAWGRSGSRSASATPGWGATRRPSSGSRMPPPPTGASTTPTAW